MSLAGVLCLAPADDDSGGAHTAPLVYRINPISHGHARLPREQRAPRSTSSAPVPLIFYSTGKTAATPGAAAMMCRRGAIMIGPRARVTFDLFLLNGTNVSPRRRRTLGCKTYRNDGASRERLRVQVHQGIFRLYSGRGNLKRKRKNKKRKKNVRFRVLAE